MCAKTSNNIKLTTRTEILLVLGVPGELNEQTVLNSLGIEPNLSSY